ncbi:Sirohydrochlorin ferrochelatase [Amycolatopsis xylanica]|uniref:Sirohydrochlorin ferrochelatase n=1 Tax=Amycolatopsis xylanica TaxID=589385 RepID=A0A1H3HED0_9PSEU|nr:sirohydrochlorin chelatase [Amycolatopsis xylanica]SDY13680.1 Sirohydrochlorin ferrochelatase [Amycolatopsis xylanica]
MTVPLVAVAHGSRDPRSAATVRALVEVVRAQAPELDVRVSFLDLSTPLVTDVLNELHREGHREAVVVPLLLGSAYHARVDLPALVESVIRPGFAVHVSDVLGIDPALEAVALDRLSGADLTDAGIVVAAVGSSNAGANAAVAALAARWKRRLGLPVTPAFASATQPDIPAAIAELGTKRTVVASWFLAPGLLPDRIAALASEADFVAEPLGPDPRVAQVILDRYEAVMAQAIPSTAPTERTRASRRAA